MSKTVTSFDIGSSRIKIAVCSDGIVRKLAIETLPENMVEDGHIVSKHAMSDFIKKTVKENHIASGACAVVLPPSLAFFGHISMPYMTTDQLELNLPYEFRDYITQEKEKYFYDYALLDITKDEEGNNTSLELMATATLKATIKEYSDMFRRAGFKLKIAAPEKFAYSNLIRNYELANPSDEPRKYCIIDLGHSTTRVYVFSSNAFDVVRDIDYGGASIDKAIAEACNVDEFLARTYKTTNYNNVQALPECRQIYTNIAIEIMRAINFYSFNYHGASIKDVYFCGSGVQIEALLQIISSTVDINIHSIEELMPPAKDSDRAQLAICSAAVGIALQ